ncbi:hypothetical protein DY000_02033719 [Brassica cretica]|uniref:Uncharacterized protein n=1 Tax=Brassica cretica TaxID=69181 RepID=A0ABQ7DUM9_BRACR|nr:hypothetical protein DY000_02033719 [Brassica cretica]
MHPGVVANRPSLLEKFHQSGVDAVGLALHSDLVVPTAPNFKMSSARISWRTWTSTAKLTLEKTLSLKLSLPPKIKSPFEFPPASGGACRCPGLGFGSGKLSAAEELRFRRFLSYLWGFDEDVERRRVVALFGSRVEIGFQSQISTGALYSSGGGKTVLFLVLDGSLSLDLRIGRLGLVVRGSRRRRQESGSPLLSRCVYRWILLPRWRVAVVNAASVAVCNTSSHQISSWRFLAASVSVRRFSRSTSEAAVLMSLTTVFWSLVFAHIPASLGSLELLVVMCVTIVCSVLGRCRCCLFVCAGAFKALGKLFSGESSSLRADHRGGQNYRAPTLSLTWLFLLRQAGSVDIAEPLDGGIGFLCLPLFS